MPESSSFLFLHIPKTAGTSFRLGAVRALGEKRCHFDYGKSSPSTSALVVRHAYEQPDLFRLGCELERADCRLFGGHFGYSKYAPLFRVDRVLAFCRHPHQQLMSHYAHFVRHHDYRDDLGRFLGSYAGAGVQRRTFGSMPAAAFGFIGVTERYDDSLRVIREEFGLRIEPMLQNVNPDKSGDDSYEVGPENRKTYDKAATQDMTVYQRANTLLDARLAALDAGYAYVHGAIQVAGHSAIRGFAFRRDSDHPVTVELVVNGRLAASCKSVDDRPGLRAANTPRNGYVGFNFTQRDLLKSGDHFEVRVGSSGQLLGSGAAEAPQEVRKS